MVPDQPDPKNANTPGVLLIGIAFLSFVSLGLPDAVLGVAWPSMRDTYGLHQSELGLVLLSSSIGYLVTSFLSGRLVRQMGVGSLLAVSTALVAVSLAGFASAPRWLLTLASAITWGMGSGAIDAGVNSYAATHFRARFINWLHGCYMIGAILGPLVMASILARGESWRTGYQTIAAMMALMALLFAATRSRWKHDSYGVDLSPDIRPGIRETLSLSAARLQMAAFLVYGGLEVVAGQWTFTLLTEARGISIATAGAWVGFYWGSLALGRFVFGGIVEHFGTDRLVRISSIGILLGTLLYLAGSGLPTLSPAALVLIGLSLAPVYPCLMARTPERLGAAHAANAVGFQASAGMAGIVLLPGLSGILAERISLEAVGGVLLVLAVLFLLLHERLLRHPGTL